MIDVGKDKGEATVYIEEEAFSGKKMLHMKVVKRLLRIVLIMWITTQEKLMGFI